MTKKQIKEVVLGSMILFVLVSAFFSFCYFVYQEFVDEDSYIHVIQEKRPGITTWETSENKKTVHHDAAAIWIMAKSEQTGRTCTWAVRNPFHAESYKIGERFDLQGIQECNRDPSPNGGTALAILFGTLLFVLILMIVLGQEYE